MRETEAVSNSLYMSFHPRDSWLICTLHSSALGQIQPEYHYSLLGVSYCLHWLQSIRSPCELHRRCSSVGTHCFIPTAQCRSSNVISGNQVTWDMYYMSQEIWTLVPFTNKSCKGPGALWLWRSLHFQVQKRSWQLCSYSTGGYIHISNRKLAVTQD